MMEAVSLSDKQDGKLTVYVARARIAAAAQIVQSYWPAGALMHLRLMYATVPSSGISIGLAVFAGLTVVADTHTHDGVYRA